MLAMFSRSVLVLLFIQGIWCAPLEETSGSGETNGTDDMLSITTEGSTAEDASSAIIEGGAGGNASVGSGGIGGVVGVGVEGGMGGSMGGGGQFGSTRGGSPGSISSSLGGSGRSGTSGGSRSGAVISNAPSYGRSGSSNGLLGVNSGLMGLNSGLMGLMNSMGNMATQSVETGHELGKAGLDMAANTVLGIIRGGGRGTVGRTAGRTISGVSNLGSVIAPEDFNIQMFSPTRTSSSYSLGQSSGQNLGQNGISFESTQGQRPSEGSNYEYSSSRNVANLGGIPAFSMNMQGQVPTSTYNYQETNSGSYGGGNTGIENAANLAIPAFSVNMQRQVPSYNDQEAESGSYGGGNIGELVMNGIQSAGNMIRPQVSVSSNTPMSSSRSGMTFTAPSSSGSSGNDIISSLVSDLTVSYNENTGNGRTVTLMNGNDALATINENVWLNALETNNNNVVLALIDLVRRRIVNIARLPRSLINYFMSLMGGYGTSSTSNLQIPIPVLSF